MNNEEIKRIIEISREKIAISNLEKEIVMEKNKINIFKLISVSCACIVLTTSVVFAKDIEKFVKEKFYFGFGDGLDNAAENGYIENPEMNLVKSQTTIETTKKLETIINNVNASVKIENFLMDDYNLSTEFYFEFDDNIKDLVNFDNVHHVELSDLMVLDEENKLIYSASFCGEEKFNEFCKIHNLNYTYLEFNENYFNNGLNCFIQNINKSTNSLGIVYNMYISDTCYSKSKKLNFYFTQITFTEADNLDNKITLTGDWNLEVKVPEKMYNRTEEYYKVIACSSSQFNVYTAKVSDTGFEIGMIINGEKELEYPEELQKAKDQIIKKYSVIGENGIPTMESQKIMNDKINELFTIEPYKTLYEEYFNNKNPINIGGYLLYDGNKMKETEEKTYILNSNGEKFECTMSPSRKAKYKFIDGNKYDFYETFGMTKYNATNQITMIINYRGEKVKVELEKK